MGGRKSAADGCATFYKMWRIFGWVIDFEGMKCSSMGAAVFSADGVRMKRKGGKRKTAAMDFLLI